MDQRQEQLIAVIEVLGRDGLVRQVQRITRWPASIGRSPACDVVLDDVHLAAEHAQVQWDEQGVANLLLMPSLNGGWMGERRLKAGDAAALGGMSNFQLGASHLRWRSNAEPLAPELPLQQHQQRAAKVAAAWVPALLLLWLGLLWFDRWSELNPGSPWVDYSSAVLGPLVVLLGWAGLWSLVTQLFQHRFPFVTHLRRALIAVTALHLIGISLPVLAFAMSWPRLLVLDAMVFPAGLAALLWWHASLVWPRARPWLALAALSGLATLTVLTVARRQEQQYWFGPPYLSTLPPPAFRLVEPKSPQALIDALRPLEAELARQANKDNDASGTEAGGEE
ncbi:FHA domain-containing protein [Roseateles oligotrophus]|uniref:FHA domain-containing protein n=1 Tax=Roseateles oligotrophus TaxID=1769250 RepID=A0ABT2YEN6_9BURK|nr:FHA domain-containing protein [Roseateles oligotrophus]MCV2368455.1 FHA domain-containing protein [Roseateles oligotrophus]